MQRRRFLGSVGAVMGMASSDMAAGSAAAQKLIRPKALRPGDTVALITPSTYVSDPDKLELARRTIVYFGLKARWGANVGKREGYLGGSIQARVDDLHAAFADPEVKAVFCIRGGYGAAMLLDRIDFDLIRRNPKIFIGYSDITALHMAIHQTTGLVTFHGPVTLSRFSGYTQDCFRRALFEPKPLGTLSNPPEENRLRPRHLARVIRPGKASGPLTGGNLSLIASLMGTPWEIRTEGKLLFIEDVGEQPYSMDRMLTQMRLAGKFRNIAGLVIGECAECVPREFQPSFESTFSLGEVLNNILGDLKVPVLTGMTIGHTDDQLTLPLGVRAALDAEATTLTIEETATEE
ncbi:MAG TPA: LD-carboxypeptidase [Bryobacteraceae bacterium]|nr:LD-carboxypeptidase [Bryobacteraceae bacterium]